MRNMNLKNLILHSNSLLLMSLSLSIFTYLWNPLGFIPLTYDEGTYIGRAMHLLVEQSPQEGTFYDHPYFGQLFLGGILWLTGYPNSIHPSANGDVVNSVKMLWLPPRLLIGIIGVVDTFLVFKISERRYNTKVAFIASILFAVIPVTFLRTLFLESLQLPFLLSSILFAIYYTKSENHHSQVNNMNKNIAFVLLSGIFLGLAIFTKIPAFTMIPLVGFLVFTYNKKKMKVLGLWFIPVILIPLIWPAYALINGQTGDWWDAIYWQTHRHEANNQDTLSNAIVRDFLKMPILMTLGFAGLIFVTLKKDSFLLFWTIPLLVFLYFLGFVRFFHLIPLLPALCISAAKLIADLSDELRHGRLRSILPFCIISAIALFGLVNLITPLIMNNNENAFAVAALVLRYLEDNKNENITTISTHVYSWIPKYVFQIGNDYLIPEISTDETPQYKKVLMVLTGSFRGIISGNDSAGKHLLNIYNEHSKNGTSTIEVGLDKIVLPQPWLPGFTSKHETNLIDNEHLWKSDHKVGVAQSNGNLDIFIKTNKTDNTTKRASLKTQLKNQTETPLLLSLEYASNSPKSKTKFLVEIRDMDDKNRRYLNRDLRDTSGNLTNQLFILPGDIVGKSLEFRLGVTTALPGEYVLNVKRAAIIYSLSH